MEYHIHPAAGDRNTIVIYISEAQFFEKPIKLANVGKSLIETHFPEKDLARHTRGRNLFDCAKQPFFGQGFDESLRVGFSRFACQIAGDLITFHKALKFS